MTIILELPESIGRELEAIWDRKELPRRILEALVIEAYRQGRTSRGKVGELLGMSFHEREAYLKERNVPYNYDFSDFEDDIRTMAQHRNAAK